MNATTSNEAKDQVEEALLELRSFAIFAEQSVPEIAPKHELDGVYWPSVLSRMTRRLEDAVTTYFEIEELGAGAKPQ